MTDKRITGERNALAVLHFLHRFGWLTTRMVSTLVWADASQGESMARRALKRLVDDQFVLRRRVPDGAAEVYTLAAAGAKRLRDELGIEAQSGKTLKLANAVHRACSNWYLILKLAEGFEVWTEHEIQTGRAPWGIVDGKAADGAVETDCGLVWVEVENAWKNRARREAIAKHVERGLGDPGHLMPLAGGRHLFRVAVVATNRDALRSIVQTFFESHRNGYSRDLHLSAVELALLPVSPGLAPGELSEMNLWYDLLLDGQPDQP